MKNRTQDIYATNRQKRKGRTNEKKKKINLTKSHRSFVMTIHFFIELFDKDCRAEKEFSLQLKIKR